MLALSAQVRYNSKTAERGGAPCQRGVQRTMNAVRERLKEKKRVVIKIGSSSLTHKETGNLDLIKLEILVREISDLRNQGIDVVLVSSGAIMVGSRTLGYDRKPATLSEKQACAAIGQAKLMMIYQKLFSEYNQVAGQILMTKSIMLHSANRKNARNTFCQLLSMGAIPIVNENDTISTHEIQFGDNAHQNPDARFIDVVEKLDDRMRQMGKDTPGSSVGTGGMATKLKAAQLAVNAGADMVIANGSDFHVIHKIMQGRNHGTLFLADPKEEFYLLDYIKSTS